jgi:hypothetical protein
MDKNEKEVTFMKVSSEILSSSEGEFSSDEDDYKVNEEIEGDTQTFSLDINNEKALKKKLEAIKDKVINQVVKNFFDCLKSLLIIFFFVLG